jgi:hypothetical protein
VLPVPAGAAVDRSDHTPWGYPQQGNRDARRGSNRYTPCVDPQDHPRELLDGLGCTVCEERVPATRVRILARRDDLIFLQVDCRSCGSTSLGFIADETPPAERGAGSVPPVSADDVLDMHDLLDGWEGDLRSLVQGGASGARGARRERSGPVDRQAGRSA